MPKQAQAQVQKVIVNIGERKKPRKKRAKRKPRVEEEPASYIRLQQPSVTYTSAPAPSTDLAQAYKLVIDKMMALQMSKNTSNVLGERQMESEATPVSAIAKQTPPLYPDMAVVETQTVPTLPTDDEIIAMKKYQLLQFARDRNYRILRMTRLRYSELLDQVLKLVADERIYLQ